MKKIISDICIIGAGPAGLTAGLFALRRGLSVSILSKDIGGQAISVPIENYPGILRTSGFDFAYAILDQMQKYSYKQYMDEVISIKKDEEIFTICTSQGKNIYANSIILACGKIPRSLLVPGEKELFGKGVEYSRIDATSYKGLQVAVVGGGSSAVQSVIALSEYASKVFLIHRRNSFSAEASDIHILKNLKNVQLFFFSVIEKINGTNQVKNIEVKNCTTNVHISLPVDRVLISIGLELNLSFLGSLVDRDERGQICITSQNETSCVGIFAAGDATAIPFHQVVISAGEGAKAALSAYKFLQTQRGARSMLMDWEHT